MTLPARSPPPSSRALTGLAARLAHLRAIRDDLHVLVAVALTEEREAVKELKAARLALATPTNYHKGRDPEDVRLMEQICSAMLASPG